MKGLKSRHLHTVALLDLGFAAGKIERFILGVKLVEHGANHVIGARVLTQRISLGEQETLERIVRGVFKESVIIHIIARLGLVKEVFLRNAVVRLGDAVGDLIDERSPYGQFLRAQ